MTKKIERLPAAMHPAPPSRRKLHLPVVEAFEQQILTGQLEIGDRLPSEAEIARQYAVSTRSVREAMQVLETKRLVRRKHGERAVVVRDDVGEFFNILATTVRNLFANNSGYLVQLMDVRRIIEVEVVRQLSSGKFAIVPEVAQALSDMSDAAEDGDERRFIDSDAAFHLGLVRSVGNEVLNVIYNNLSAIIIDVIRVTSRVPDKSLQEGYAEHVEIFNMIQSGKVEAACAAVRKQIQNTAKYLKIALDNAALSKGMSND